MTPQVHWNGQEDPSGHSCPPEPQLRRHKDGWSLDGISGVYSHFWEESAKQLMVPMTLQVHWNGWEDPSGHSCPPKLQLRRRKDRWSLERIRGGYSLFWEESPKLLMVPMTLQVHWNGWEDPSGHSCPPQLQLSRHKDRCHLCLEGGLMFW